MTWWKGLIAALLVVGAGAITFGGLRERPPAPTEVQLSKARKGTITRTLAGAGKVQAATTVKISSNVSGELTELLVKEGDRVTKGQVLARVDRRRIEAAAKQANAAQSAARADITLAQVDVDRTTREQARVKGLVDKGMASPAELERAQSDLDAARARVSAAQQRHAQAGATVDEARTQLANTTLVAPIDGTVIELSREVGERVRGSDLSEDVVMTIAALNAMEVEIEVGEHEVVHLAKGQRSEITMDALEGQAFEGTVVEVAQKALIKNPGTEAEVTTFPVKVALATRPPGVLPGMSAEVRVFAETHNGAILVPIQSVTVRPEKSLPDAPAAVPGDGTSLSAGKRGEQLAKVVFVVDTTMKATARKVRTGIASDTELEILEGLQEGDRVIEGPYRTLSKELKHGDVVTEGKGGPGGPRGRQS
ncbi:MAG: efflux RND transporter periplasmic adaptor subunit [Myxococcaceae bacterium]|nr:efflux RND transporter periplasmic adaptor subunit [Myxococcaceae bacterium]MCI0671998.1 efflux RND transporter periplasmic adaptor subunit [Myxococcaceae bacterium]